MTVVNYLERPAPTDVLSVLFNSKVKGDNDFVTFSTTDVQRKAVALAAFSRVVVQAQESEAKQEGIFNKTNINQGTVFTLIFNLFVL